MLSERNVVLLSVQKTLALQASPIPSGRRGDPGPPWCQHLRCLRRWLAVLIVLASALSAPLACESPPSETNPKAHAASPAAGIRFQVRDDTPNLLITWVDDQGDFHVVQKPSAVPAASRALVRVAVTPDHVGTQDHVYVADLRTKKPDGTYAVRTVPRAEWDEVGAAKRKSRLEALAPQRAPSSSAGKDAGSGASAGRVRATVYGADWCKPCHQAERYLRTLGVDVVVKDIESSETIRSELRAKLRKARLPPSSSIPIIDVAGKLMVGFDPRAVEQAVREARKGQR